MGQNLLSLEKTSSNELVIMVRISSIPIVRPESDLKFALNPGLASASKVLELNH